MQEIKPSALSVRIFLWIVLGAICSCGRAPAFMSAVSDAPTIELATKQQIAAGDVANASYIVMFRGENTQESIYFSSFHDEYQHHYLRLQEDVASDFRVKDIDILWSLDLSPKKNSEWSAEFGVPKELRLFWEGHDEAPVTGVMTKVDFSSPEDAKTVLEEWETKGILWYAEPNGVSSLTSADQCSGKSKNDCLAPCSWTDENSGSCSSVWTDLHKTYKSADLWWHKSIKLAEAMNAIEGLSDKQNTSDAPIIAVLDSGVDYEHPALRDSLWYNDAQGAWGCDGDKYGCNTTSPSRGSLGNGEVWPAGATGPNQDNGDSKGGHGTHVAGIIAAKKNKDVLGVCPVCKVMIVKIAASESGDNNADPKIRDDSQIRGFKYITKVKKNNGTAVRIANSSFGKYGRSRSIAILVDALGKIGSGTMIIAAASNEDSMIRSYPAALNNALAVAALREDLHKAKYSNFGPWVDIAAPGGSGESEGQINSTWPGGATNHPSSGTSMAAPVVAGAAGLYLALYPSTSLATLRSRLLDTANGSIYDANTDAGAFNAKYYFPKVSGEEVNRPLLGSGNLDVQNMFAGLSNSTVGKPHDRVTAGCATIGASHADGAAFTWLCLLVMIPLVVRAVVRFS